MPLPTNGDSFIFQRKTPDESKFHHCITSLYNYYTILENIVNYF